jgi:hypothetical protein
METEKNSTVVIKKRKLTDLPTKEEQLHLRETENLIRSNLLKLQLDELINEVRFHKSEPTIVKNKLDKWLESFLKFLRNIEYDQTLSQDWLNKNHIHGIKLKAYSPKQVQMQFRTPKSVNIIGSYSFKAITRPFLNIDIAVEVPPECFEGK